MCGLLCSPLLLYHELILRIISFPTVNSVMQELGSALFDAYKWVNILPKKSYLSLINRLRQWAYLSQEILPFYSFFLGTFGMSPPPIKGRRCNMCMHYMQLAPLTLFILFCELFSNLELFTNHELLDTCSSALSHVAYFAGTHSFSIVPRARKNRKVHGHGVFRVKLHAKNA